MRTKTGFPRFLGSKIPLSQSLYWRPSADQKARGLWVRDWARAFVPWRWPKGTRLWGRECAHLSSGEASGGAWGLHQII